MAKFDQRSFDSKNRKELEKMANWLRQGPKVCLQAAVTRAHSTVMQSENLGGAMMHDSSNAAYNWRISVNGSMPPVLFQKGRPPVGNEGDQRTREGKTSDIIRTILKRLTDDANELDRALWGTVTITQVSLVNPIKGYYAINAQLDEAVAGHIWRPSAQMAAEDAFNAWFNGGPNVNWKRHAKTTFGAGELYGW
ncbi:hypothetical protein vBVpaS1601_19 [Vibrio phage vB_VpaS_1601]|uniref:hypothetical protein n=1 Tax=Vibrio phage SHOU24 TaxID=1414739 RepID=UPI0003ED2438|nr:hypothetical protein SHOU24_67 [Vibrio phage SHOU24]AHI61264.1 hypothetical protein SHOU24_67 [Vibrio phage SHOU24]WHM52712.1 hypothetical protein vBVpaP1601_19 [Vibrio phage vB_VpaP_1601]